MKSAHSTQTGAFPGRITSQAHWLEQPNHPWRFFEELRELIAERRRAKKKTVRS